MDTATIELREPETHSENAIAEQSDLDIAHELATTLKAAGDPLRLQILAVLSSNSFGVLELCQVFEAKQSGMSHHLKVLARADLVSTRREGNTIFYRRSDSPAKPQLESLRDAIYTSAASFVLDANTQQNLEAVYSQRAEASREFFRNNTEAFKQQQELIASIEVYGPEVSKVIDSSAYPSNHCALEIGPGIGEYLNQLSRRFEHVIALDTSEHMLKRCEQFANTHHLNNIQLVEGDTAKCTHWPEHVDCAVINMVLHHTPSPQQIFADAATALKPGGVLIVSDLAAHDQDWVRDACGDHWLGFRESDLVSWARSTGLHLGLSRFFALRNGFQIQIHQFRKLQ